MSGETILIERLRADVSQLRDDRAELQERCNRLTAERNAAINMVASADSEWKARAEKAERERDELRSAHGQSFLRVKVERDDAIERAEKAEDERDEWKARHDTLADVSRATIATVERERDEARAERDAYKRAKEENDERFMRERDEARAERDARPDISPEDAAGWSRAEMDNFFEPDLSDRESWARVTDALRAHAAKAVKP